MSEVLFGIDRLLADPEGLPGRIGLVTNDAARLARNAQLHSRVAMQDSGFQLVRLFSPEHGLNAGAPDGAAVADSSDAITGLPIVSLYGERMRPSPEALTNLDAVVFDIPDIGARFYTYIWTLSHVLEACAEASVPLVILDRPNPLGGNLADAEGPLLDPEKISSFVGRAAIPVRHSLTVGELARLWNVEWNLNADLRVIPCSGWRRAMHWPDTGMPFVPTSPAIANYESALLYPGLCLFEATNLSVGRGTLLPFQVVGAPWLRAEETAQHFNSLKLPGVEARGESFVPAQSPFTNQSCAGVKLTVTDPKSFRPVGAGLHLLATVIGLHSGTFCWMDYPTAANPRGTRHFERLIGQAGIREALEAHPLDLRARVDQWTTAPGWAGRAKKILLYD